MPCGIFASRLYGSFLNIYREIMYKSILLTNKELDLLVSLLGQYISHKDKKDQFSIVNAHVILRHLNDKKSNQPSNQIAFYGK